MTQGCHWHRWVKTWGVIDTAESRLKVSLTSLGHCWHCWEVFSNFKRLSIFLKTYLNQILLWENYTAIGLWAQTIKNQGCKHFCLTQQSHWRHRLKFKIRISQQNRCYIRVQFREWNSGLGEDVWWKKQRWKISWYYPFWRTKEEWKMSSS